MNNQKVTDILKIIDHTLLKQDATIADVVRVCEEAKKYGFYSVITHPYYISEVRRQLFGSEIVCGTVVGFPFGCELTETKAFQTKCALEHGANEIDMVMAIAALKNKDYSYVFEDIKKIVKEAEACPVKVILETSLLNEDEIRLACKISMEAGAAFVKTSTGYFGNGATLENLKIMSDVCFGKIGVKASGGIRTAEDALAVIKAGATRIGTSGGVKIAEGLINDSDY